MKKFDYIEIGRGIAALLVVMRHATRNAPFFYQHIPFANFFYFGNAGVDFFFVLSGFLIYYIHSDNTIADTKRYILKRLIRIYPTFLIINSILLFSYLTFPQLANRSITLNMSYILHSFFLLPSPDPRILGVSWTLVHEMFFYFIFIILIINKKIGFLIFFIWSFSIFSYNLMYDNGIFPFDFYLSKYNLEFILGITAAFLIKSNKIYYDEKYLQNLIIFIGFMIFFMNGMNENYKLIEINDFTVTIIYGLSSFLMIIGMTMIRSPKHKNYFFKLLLLLGSASYSIYLVHNPLLSVLHRVVQKVNLALYIEPNIIFLILVITCLGVGIGLHLYIEKPLLKYITRSVFKTD